MLSGSPHAAVGTLRGVTPERTRSSFFICRDGFRWQFFAESNRGSEVGWRFTERVEQPCFQHNVPAHMAMLAK